MAEIRKQAKAAMFDAAKASYTDLNMELYKYYRSGTPDRYVRTYKMLNSASHSDPLVSEGKDSVGFTVYMDGNYQYTTGKKPSGYTVFRLAEDGHLDGYLPTVGRTGTWEAVEEDVQKDIEKAMRRHGFR